MRSDNFDLLSRLDQAEETQLDIEARVGDLTSRVVAAELAKTESLQQVNTCIVCLQKFLQVCRRVPLYSLVGNPWSGFASVTVSMSGFSVGR